MSKHCLFRKIDQHYIPTKLTNPLLEMLQNFAPWKFAFETQPGKRLLSKLKIAAP